MRVRSIRAKTRAPVIASTTAVNISTATVKLRLSATDVSTVSLTYLDRNSSACKSDPHKLMLFVRLFIYYLQVFMCFNNGIKNKQVQ